MNENTKSEGNNKLPVFIGLGVSALVLIFTNPSKDKFLQYASGSSPKSCISKSGQSDPVKQDLEKAVLDICKELQAWGTGTIGDITTRQNFLFFSIYSTNLGDYKSSAIGILGTFIRLGR
jgi:hypothetical protein